MTGRCVSARLYFRLFPLFCALFFFIGLFLRYFNDLSCIWRAPTPCKSPVFFYNGLFHERAADWFRSQQQVDCTPPVRHENERLWAPAWPGVRKPPYAIALTS
jgi:hypothetical protein